VNLFRNIHILIIFSINLVKFKRKFYLFQSYNYNLLRWKEYINQNQKLGK
jgi:hypothetical protein